MLGSGLLAWPFAQLLHEDRRTFVPPMMFNNCGNMGLPLAVLAFGQAGLLGDGRAVHDLEPAAFHARRAGSSTTTRAFGSLLRNPMVWSTFARLRVRARRIRRCPSG